MLKAGYDVKLAASSITAGGCPRKRPDPPPLVLLILYGATAACRWCACHAGALLPGIMLAV